MKKIFLLLGLWVVQSQAWAETPLRPYIADIKPAYTKCAMEHKRSRTYYGRANYGLAIYKNHFLLLDKQGHWHILGKKDPNAHTAPVLMDPVSCFNSFTAIYQNKEWQLYDGETGQKLNQNIPKIEDIGGNITYYYDFIPLKQQGKWAVWRKQNGELRQITPSQYDGFKMGNTWSSRRLEKHNPDDIRYFQAALNGKWGVIDTKGNWIVPAKYDEWDILLYKNIIKIGVKGQIYDILDYSGKKLMRIDKSQFETFIYPEMQGLILKNKKTKKYGFMNFQGKWVLSPKYDLIGEPTLNRAVIVKGKREGFINEKGKIVIPMVFENLGNSTATNSGFVHHPEQGITSQYIWRCWIKVDIDGALIDDDDFSCSPNPTETHPQNIDKWNKIAKKKAVHLLQSRGLKIKWRKPSEIPDPAPIARTPEPTVVRDPLPDLPDE